MKVTILAALLLFSTTLYSNTQIKTINQSHISDVDSVLVSIPGSIFKVSPRDYSRKGKFFVHWGYNFSWYADSDISFKGKGYDFVLKNVAAQDRPTKLSWTYINPAEISIPQFNFHAGYFIKDNYSISIGWDHMKYVIDVPQQVKITGHIDEFVSEPGIATGTYEGTYSNDDLTITSDFLTFEHTDGFNYASVEVERYDDAWVSKSKKRTLTLETGLGLGVVVPRTDVRFFKVGQNNYWNLAGWGVSVKAGLKYYFSKQIYFQGNLKAGHTNLSDIHTTGRNDIDGASQKINYLENYWVLGFQF